MSIVITVGAILMVSVLPEAGNTNAKTISDIDKLQTVEEHMRSFMAFNGRRPCPADGQYPELGTGSQYFGQEAGTPGTCTGNTAPTPNAPLGPDAGTGYIVSGVIPTRSIGLDDSYAFDSYGRRFTYVVDKRATDGWTSAKNNNRVAGCPALEGLNSVNTNPSSKGGITIADAAGNVIDNVMYAYVSHGPSGYGAFPGDGSATTLTSAQSAARRVNSGSTDAAMQVDAAVDVHLPSGASTFTPSLTNVLIKNSSVQPSTTGGKLDTGFDDMVWYRDDLKNTCCLGRACVQQGIRADGKTAGDDSGSSVAVGDVNGDGIPDLIIGATGANYGSGACGACGSVYVVFGTRNGFPDPLPLSTLNGTNGFRLDGIALGSDYYNGYWAYTGWSVAVGDINGDGVKDIIIGTRQSTAFVVFGGSGPKSGGTWANCYNNYASHGCPLSYTWLGNGTSTAVNGFRLDGVGAAAASGDINADGYADILIGSTIIYGGPCPQSGCVGGGWPVTQRVSAGGTGTVIFTCNAQPTNGQSIVLNGKTWTFVTSGATGNETNIGASFNATITQLISDLQNSADPKISAASYGSGGYYGGCGWGNTITITDKTSGTDGTDYTLCSGGVCNGSNQYIGDTNVTASGLTLSGGWLGNGTGNAVNGFKLIGEASGDSFGAAVSAGDVNGDGYADIIAGAPTNHSGPGAVYVIYGVATAKKKDGTTMPVALTVTPDGTNIVRFNGRAGYTIDFGATVAVGDVNGDGIADIVAASGDCVTYSTSCGVVYVIFGTTHGWPTTPLDVRTDLTGTAGLSNTPSTGGSLVNLGISPNTVPSVAVGDVNGDGIADILITMWGKAYTLFGTSGAWAGTVNTVSSYNGTTGFELSGSIGQFPSNFLAIGDLNGDGLGDIIAGSYSSSPNGASSGSTYVYFGKKTRWPATPYNLGGL